MNRWDINNPGPGGSDDASDYCEYGDHHRDGEYSYDDGDDDYDDDGDDSTEVAGSHLYHHRNGGGGGGGGPSRLETVPLTPRDSLSSTQSSTQSSVASRSVYLSFFRSPSATAATPTSQNQHQNRKAAHAVVARGGGGGGGGGGRSFSPATSNYGAPSAASGVVVPEPPTRSNFHQQQMVQQRLRQNAAATSGNRRTPKSSTLYPVRENYRSSEYAASQQREAGSEDEEEEEEEDEEEEDSKAGGYLSWQQQKYHQQQHRHFGVGGNNGGHHVAGAAAAAPPHHRHHAHQNDPDRRHSNDSGSVFQSVRSGCGDDDDSEGCDGLSILSSASHLFGEQLARSESASTAAGFGGGGGGAGAGGSYDVEEGGGGNNGGGGRAFPFAYADPPSPPHTRRPASGWTDLVAGWLGANRGGLAIQSNYWHWSGSWNPSAWRRFNPWSSSAVNSGHQQPSSRTKRVRRARGAQRLTLSPRSRNLQDLGYLSEQHKAKMNQLSLCLLENPETGAVEVVDYNASSSSSGGPSQPQQEQYDFALILQPQEVYGFWASLLDFREELLGPEAVQAMEAMWESQVVAKDQSQPLSINATDDTDEASSSPSSPSAGSVNSGHSSPDSFGPKASDVHEHEESANPESILGSGLRRRGQTPKETEKRTMTAEVISNSAALPFTSPGMASIVSMASTTLTRKSLFERAMGSPTSSLSPQPGQLLPVKERWLTNCNKNNKSINSMDPGAGVSTPMAGVTLAAATVAGSGGGTSVIRRRWGNQAAGQFNTPSMMSPPIRSLTRGSSMHKNPTQTRRSIPKKQQLPTPAAKEGEPTDNSGSNGEARSTEDDVSAAGFENDDPNILKMQDIPPQRFARGIASRTNGMLPFLSALKRGIVLRKHRACQTAIYCKLYSEDGGDTIRFVLVEPEDAITAFREQRVRYNKVKYNTNQGHRPDNEQEGAVDAIMAQPWSLTLDYSETNADEAADGADAGDDDCCEDINKDFSKPDYVAAQEYREKIQRKRVVGQRIKSLANKIVQSGSIRAQDIAAVHPGTFVDPRSTNSSQEELGTSTFRRSKSEYDPRLSFSLVLRADRLLNAKKGHKDSSSIGDIENRWLTGQGSEKSFQYFDFEAATVGEYWLVFRGFLLLHRDAAVGRFAEHRAAGIGSHYSRLELDHRKTALASSSEVDRLHVDEFHEPITVGCGEKLMVKCRGLDATYMDGYTLKDARPPPSDYFLGFRSPGTAIWSRLRQAGLETTRIYSLDPNRVMIKIRCPPERLMDVATVIRLKLPTRDGGYAPFREDMLDFFQSMDDPLETLPASDASNPFNPFNFRSSLRSTIIDFIVGSRIRDSGAELSQNTDLGRMVQARVPLHMRGKLDAIYSSWFYFWHVDNWKGGGGRSMSYAISSSKLSEKIDSEKTDSTRSVSSSKEEGPSSEKDAVEEEEIPNLFTRFFVGCFYQPLDDVERYFGEKVAFYFAWLQHTAAHLLFLSVAGLTVFVFQVSSGNWDHPIRLFFSMMVMIWTFTVLVNWRKRANFLAYRWGTIDYKEQETTRPQFRGDYVLDEITGEWVVTYPSWKRYLKYAISFPLTLLFTAVSLFLIFWVHANRDLQMANYMEQKSKSASEKFEFDFEIDVIANMGKRAPVVEFQITRAILSDPAFWMITVGMPSVLGLFLPLLNLTLMKISVLLNDFENYRTESEYRTYLVIKVFSFRFVCYFATLYYYAFVSIGSETALENGLLRVATGVLVYTTVAQWWSNILHVCFPIAIRKLRMRHRRNRLCEELRSIELAEEEVARWAEDKLELDDDLKQRRIELVNKRLLLEQAQDDIWLEVMLPQHDSFPEYIQAVVQFTYVSCFSVALPITPLIVLFNYLLCMRLDAYKLCKGRRRPLAEKTGGIGIWEHLLHIVAVISVLTNCWLMGFTTSTFLNIGKAVGQVGLFAIVVGWEHVMLLIKYIMHNSISQLPKSVRDAMKREQHNIEMQRSDSMMQARRLQHQREEEYRHQMLQSNTEDSDGNGAVNTPALSRYPSVSRGFDNISKNV